jgi:hypothetical protein
MDLEDMVPETETLEALAWLELSLEQLRDRGHFKAEYLLASVLTEVIFELDASRVPPAAS